MQLVFAHGWAFDASFWDDLAPLLTKYPQHRVDLGFFGMPKSFDSIPPNSVLIGHSLGFMVGVQQAKAWKGLISINSFTRFVDKPSGAGCIPEAALQDLKLRLGSDPHQALRDFYALIRARPPQAPFDTRRLSWGLDVLEEGDVSSMVKNSPVPVLALASRNDPLVPVAASRRIVSQNSLILHDKGGHLLPQSDAAFCATHIENFLSKLGG